ncbi:DUF4215 domain-containing protein, partial [Myxococcota bacterium]
VEAGWYCPVVGAPCIKLDNCGDGRRSVGELCDDDDYLTGAPQPGDGCDEFCRTESGWICPVSGLPCQKVPECGNGVVEPNGQEECDDGNTSISDGCSDQCRIEASFWDCSVPAVPCVNTIQCGDGKVEGQEQCDDGPEAIADGDGCSTACLLEANWICRVPGKPCQPICGDAVIVEGREECDDGNAASGDGCSSTCRVEGGWTCPGAGQPCTQPVCGNGDHETGEQCDLGPEQNGLFYGDGTGCSKTCTQEPTCRDGTGQTVACTSTCGDGNRDIDEGCDDGNSADGDGCSSACEPEGGFTCADNEFKDTEPCSETSGDCLVIPITYRDFDGANVAGTGHPDFFFLGKNGVTCVPNANGDPVALPADGLCVSDTTDLCQGIVQDTLGPDGKPQLGTQTKCDCRLTDWNDTGVITGTDKCYAEGTGANHTRTQQTVQVVESAGSFRQWYHDPEGTPSPTDGTKVLDVIELAQLGGSNLYQFSSSEGRTILDDIHDAFLGNSNTLTSGFFPLEGTDREKVCNLWPYWQAGLESECVAADGNIVWSQWDALVEQSVPGGDGAESTRVIGQLRNFYFTSEVRYLFRYEGGEELAFFGDDDVWVFLNGKLVLDLGAPHERISGTVELTGDNAAEWTVSAVSPATGNETQVAAGTTRGLGLTQGKIYEIAVFHADRHPRDSNYQLTLSGFSTIRSECNPACGDGVATAGEECDEGANNNDSVYGGCTLECKYGPFCGDGIVDTPDEECDDGQNVTAGYNVGGCAPGCRIPPVCGDGILDSLEQCDNGMLNQDGLYGGCTTLCTLGPYCGDGAATDGEQCDDGLNLGGYGMCAEGCVLGPRCGDAVQDDGELCDEGAELNGLEGHCTADCGIAASCGDGVVQSDSEQCDDGTNDGQYGGCNPDCTWAPRCGDQVVQRENGEACDDGTNDGGYGECAEGCKLGPFCGDGVVDDGYEECDYMNPATRTNCSSTCRADYITT